MAEGLCEASAIALSPWSPNRFLVADNEVHDRLFVFRREGSSLVAEAPLPLPEGAPRDIEALAVHAVEGVPALTIVGSHSKTRSCEGKRKRRRVMTVARREGELVALGGVEALVPECVQGSPLCAVADGCFQTDIEAAARDHEGALWFGFRTPPGLLMSRLPRGKRSFAQLATGGRGVRGLTHHQGRLIGLLGPKPGSDNHQLFVVERGALQSSSQIDRLEETPIGRTHEVPSFSEGLVIDRDGSVIVVIDGQNGSGTACTEPARYAFVPSVF